MAFDEKLRDPAIDELFQALLRLKTVNECYRFFYDLCTVGEIKSLAHRTEIVMMLCEGKSYSEIAQKTKASSATISRIKRFVDYGADGYTLMYVRLRKHPEEG